MAEKKGARKAKASNTENSAKTSRSGKAGAASKDKPRPPPRERVIDAALALAAEGPWSEVTLQDIAARAGVPLADMVDEFATRLAVVRAFMRRIDRKVLEGLDPELAGEPARERLFDVLIGRFEALNPYKEAMRGISSSVNRDPDALMVLNRAAIRSQLVMMAAAGIDAEGFSGIARAQGLAIIFARTFSVWLEDDDPGMARTMAALDRRLRDGERLLRPLRGLNTVARVASAFCAALLSRRGRDGKGSGA